MTLFLSICLTIFVIIILNNAPIVMNPFSQLNGENVALIGAGFQPYSYINTGSRALVESKWRYDQHSIGTKEKNNRATTVLGG